MEEQIVIEQSANPIMMLLPLVLVVFMIIVGWKVMAKAGLPGWGIFIPIYNIYLMCKLAGKPGWWLLLMFVPIANLIVSILVNVGIAERFGKGIGFAVGLILLPFIFFPILAFGSAVYTPVAE